MVSETKRRRLSHRFFRLLRSKFRLREFFFSGDRLNIWRNPGRRQRFSGRTRNQREKKKKEKENMVVELLTSSKSESHL